MAQSKMLVLMVLLIQTTKAQITQQCNDADYTDWKTSTFAKFPSSINKCATKSLTIDSYARECFAEEWPNTRAECRECAIPLFQCLRRACVNSCVRLDAISGKNYFGEDCMACAGGQNNLNEDCISPSVQCLGWSPFVCPECKQTVETPIFAGLSNDVSIGIISGVCALLVLICCGLFYYHRKHMKEGHEDMVLPPLETKGSQISVFTNQSSLGLTNPGNLGGMSPMMQPQMMSPQQQHPMMYNFMHPFGGGGGQPHQQQQQGFMAGSPPGMEGTAFMPNTIGFFPQQQNGYQPQSSLSTSSTGDNNSLERSQTTNSAMSFMMNPLADRPMMTAESKRNWISSSQAQPLRARYSFHGINEDELDVPEGAQLEGVHLQGEWWFCNVVGKGQTGLIPASYVEIG